MKSLIARAVTAAFILATVAGCAPGTQFINPRPPISGRADTVTVTDSRSVTAISTRQGRVEADRFVGQTLSLVVAMKNGSVGDLIGSIVAVNYPQAHVDVSEFVMTVDYGMWLATATVKITAEITPVEKSAFVVRASGSENYYAPSAENLELSVNAALADFADKLRGGTIPTVSALSTSR